MLAFFVTHGSLRGGQLAITALYHALSLALKMTVLGTFGSRGEVKAGLIEAREKRGARIAKAAEEKGRAEALLAKAQKAVEEARAANDAVQGEFDAAQKAAKNAKAAGKTAMATIAEAKRRVKPLSAFVSRKTGRLYVRQNFKQLFDVPVTIRGANREIGTHIYVSTGAANDGSALRWQVVSMPSAVVEPPPLPSRSEYGRLPEDAAYEMAASSAIPPGPETAQGALDRLIIPEDTMRRLNKLAWVGATVIISDYGMSGETGSTTDFIVETKSRRHAR